MSLHLEPLINLPLIKTGDDIVSLLIHSFTDLNIQIMDGDIIAITSKIISKSEGRFINLKDIQPSSEAKEISRTCQKDVRLIEIILRESKEILRVTKETIITEHRLGFINANAGIDHSNVCEDQGSDNHWYLLLPLNPDQSARHIQNCLVANYKKNIGVIIIDSHGRAWRKGTIGCTIGTAGVPMLIDLRGEEDLFGYRLRITQIAAADELAAAASLIMGQAKERIPAVHIRGFPYGLQESSLKDIIRVRSSDLFR